VNTPAHLSIGAAATLALCAAVSASPVFAAGAGLASLVGSRAPDWDIRLERWRRNLARVWLVGRPFRWFSVPHRGPTHWERAPLLGASTALLLAVVSLPALAITVGVLMATDGCLLGSRRKTELFPVRMMLAGAAVYVLWYSPVWTAALGIALGCAHHIMADRCSIKGTERDPLLGGGRVFWLTPRLRAWVSHGGDRYVGGLAVLLAVGFAALLSRGVLHSVA
jgi:hypothetical protein